MAACTNFRFGIRAAFSSLVVVLVVLLGFALAPSIAVGQVSRECSDRIDNDGDGLIDFPEDPGCNRPRDNNEFNLTACSDFFDNDGDGLADYPADPDCSSLEDDDEAVTPPPPPPPPPPPGSPPVVVVPVTALCADGVDNDFDTKIDAADPGCASAADNDEADPRVVVVGSSVASLLSPFPVVRLRGRTLKDGARVTGLSVTAAIGTQITIRCRGPLNSCPRARFALVATRPITRMRAYERRMRGGTLLKIFVTRQGRIGKYTRFTIRRGRAPLRKDACARSDATSLTCP